MKVLILSCNTGGGHNAAGRAIRASFAEKGIPCDLQDTLSFASPLRESFVCKGHVFAYRYLPRLYGQAYQFVENHPPQKGRKSGVYRSNISYADRIYQFIQAQGYDTVICVHIFAATALTHILQQHPGLVHSYFVATDYTCSPGASDAEMDAYIIPHPALTAEFAAAGIPAGRIWPLGIPVGQAFCQKGSRAQARLQLGLPEQRRVVLMMCGSMGCGPMRQLAEGCLAELPSDSMLVAVCGDNRRLYEELSAIHSERLRVVGYTNQVSAYMDAADLLLSKAGGLSSTEAVAKGLPILFVDAVPGVESRNRDFFAARGCALTADGTEALVALVAESLNRPQQLQALVEAQKDFPKNAARQLTEAICRQAAIPPRSAATAPAREENE